YPAPARGLRGPHRQRSIPRGAGPDFRQLRVVAVLHCTRRKLWPLDALACPAHAPLAIRPDGLWPPQRRRARRLLFPDLVAPWVAHTQAKWVPVSRPEGALS